MTDAGFAASVILLLRQAPGSLPVQYRPTRINRVVSLSNHGIDACGASFDGAQDGASARLDSIKDERL